MIVSRQTSIDFGRCTVVLRVFRDRLSWRLDARGMIIIAILCGLAVLMAILSLNSGKYPMAVMEVIGTLAGVADAGSSGGADDMARMIVFEWRLPRVALALLLGSALGMSGAIFQSLTRNPLGSPDVIGFSAGSYTGALVVILMMSGGYYETAAGALTGGIMSAATVYLLAWRRGVQGFRLIIIGIGVAAMLGAFNSWMIRQADLQVAMSASIWGAGSLNGLGFDQLVPVTIVLCCLVPTAIFLSRPMRQLELGDDTARASGIKANAMRLVLMVLGVALTATVTAAAGPISFIALAAPQIARRLTRSGGVALLPAGLTGGVLLIAADWAAQHALGVQLPVGVMTVSIGGFYFIWLLIREGRK